MKTRTVYCVGFAGDCVGGVDWYDEQMCAQARYASITGDKDYDKDDVELFSLVVPEDANDDEVTDLADAAAHEGADEGKTLIMSRPAASSTRKGI